MYSKILNYFLKVIFFILFSFTIIFISFKNFLSYKTFDYLFNGKKLFIDYFPLHHNFLQMNFIEKNFIFFNIFSYLNSIWFGLNSFIYYKIFLLFIAFFILFLVIYKRLQGKYISIILPFVFFPAFEIIKLNFSPILFDILFLSFFLYILERTPSLKNKNLYYSLIIIFLFWSLINFVSAFISFFIFVIYYFYRIFDLKEQPKKEEKYNLKIFAIPFLFILLLFFLIFFLFLIDIKNILDLFKNTNLNFHLNYIYIIFYFFILFFNLKGVDIGRKSEFIKDIFISFLLLFFSFINKNFYFLFLTFSIPTISYYIYLVFKWDFVWEKKWTEKNLIYIKNLFFIVLICINIITLLIYNNFYKKELLPLNVLKFLSNENVPENIYSEKSIYNFLNYYFFPEKKILNNLDNYINTFILEKNSKIYEFLHSKNFKTAYFDDNFYILVNTFLTKNFFKNINPLDENNFFDKDNLDFAIKELESFTQKYPSEKSILMLAKLYAEKDINYALKYLEEKIVEYPNFYELYNFYGELLYKIEDYSNAYEILKKSRKKNKKIIEIIKNIKNKIN